MLEPLWVRPELYFVLRFLLEDASLGHVSHEGETPSDAGGDRNVRVGLSVLNVL